MSCFSGGWGGKTDDGGGCRLNTNEVVSPQPCAKTEVSRILLFEMAYMFTKMLVSLADVCWLKMVGFFYMPILNKNFPFPREGSPKTNSF